MPVRKHANRKNTHDPEKMRGNVLPKEIYMKPRLQIEKTGKELKKSHVTTFATAKKKKRPKS